MNERSRRVNVQDIQANEPQADGTAKGKRISVKREIII